jgi:hypothetical protein
VVRELDPYLEDAYWSYVRRGVALPGEAPETAGAKRWDTRRQDPMWYNDTCFSMVLESITQWDHAVIFLTEKIFKPISHQHPYMVIGANGILDYLKSQGFETFDNLFDESYDQAAGFVERLNKIEHNIANTAIKPYDNITVEKIRHNYNHFFDEQLVVTRMIQEVINPLLEYVAR